MVSEPPASATFIAAVVLAIVISVPIVAWLAHRDRRSRRSPYECPGCGALGIPEDPFGSDRYCPTPRERCRVRVFHIGRDPARGRVGDVYPHARDPSDSEENQLRRN